MMPTVPLLAPANALAAIAHGKERENPNSREAFMVQNKPSNITGFRPKRSEARPHAMAVMHCASENIAEVMPAYEDVRRRWDGKK